MALQGSQKIIGAQNGSIRLKRAHYKKDQEAQICYQIKK